MKLQDKSNHTSFVTDERGYLVTTAKLARTGAMEYLGSEIGRDANKVYEVHVDPEDLFNDETIKSFEGQPVTIEHPEEAEVTASNWDDLAVGHISNVRQDGEFLIGDVIVNSPKAIKTIQDGKVEVSCGYDADLIENNGIIKKTNIKGNHLAIVDEGRCGANCKLGDGKPSVMSKLIKKLFGDKKAKQRVKLGDAKKRLVDVNGVYQQKMADLQEVVASDAPVEEKAAAIEAATVEVNEALAEVTETLEQIEELSSEIEKEAPTETTANDELTAEEEAKIADLEAQVIEKDELIKELEEKLAALEEKEAAATTANDVKRVFGDKVAVTNKMSSTDMKRAVVVATGAYNDSNVKTLTDCALNSAYAAALTVSAKSNLGKRILGDSKPKAKTLPKSLGGK